jgi:molybdopterin-guanine dinucleotide biosynthesis protein B
MKMIPVLAFVGFSNSGKTTVLTRVIAELKKRGFRIGVIKHDVHGFQVDQPGKDTWRHAQAGADAVCISSPARMALIRKVGQELKLDEILRQMPAQLDIVFTEGFKTEAKDRIEVYRRAAGTSPLGARRGLLAVVADCKLYENVVHFGLEDTAAIADFIIGHFGLLVKDWS